MTWKEPRYDNAASLRHWRAKMGAFFGVEPTYIEQWEVEQFMREMQATRQRLVGEKPASPATATASAS